MLYMMDVHTLSSGGVFEYHTVLPQPVPPYPNPNQAFKLFIYLFHPIPHFIWALGLGFMNIGIRQSSP